MSAIPKVIKRQDLLRALEKQGAVIVGDRITMGNRSARMPTGRGDIDGKSLKSRIMKPLGIETLER